MLLLVLLFSVSLTGCLLQPVTSQPGGTLAGEALPQPIDGENLGSDSDLPASGASDSTAVTSIVESTAAPTPTPTPEPTVYSGPPSDEHPAIALTFDDGPSTDLTPQFLDILREKNAQATFFVLGNRLYGAREEILRREVAEGHEIGNHTFSHMILKKADAATTRDELVRTSDLIAKIAGVTPTIMRPPTGGYSAVTETVTTELGLVIVNWSWQSCPEDWNHKNDPDAIADFVIENAANGHIILLHDTNSATLAALPRILDELTAKGFRMMTVSELLAYSSEGMPSPGTVVSKLK